MDAPSGGPNSGKVHAWLASLTGNDRERYLRGMDIAAARQARAVVGSPEWHHWATVIMAIGHYLLIDRRPDIGDLLESAEHVEPPIAAAA